VLKAISNSSTLIRLYRTTSFLAPFKKLYEHILIPDFCWAELLKKPDYEANTLMKKDIDRFLVVVKPTTEEMKLTSELIFTIKEITDLSLDLPEAIAIAIAEKRGIDQVLSEDKVAISVPYLIELNIEVLNSLEILKVLMKEKILRITTRQEFEKLITKFESESRERFRKKDIMRIMDELL
jgi:predicted nucleic acid-binding protein